MTFLRFALIAILMVAPLSAFGLNDGLPRASAAPANAKAASTPPAKDETAPKRDDDLPTVPVPVFSGAQGKLNAWKETLDTAEQTLRFRVISEATLNELRDRSGLVQAGVRELIGEMTPKLDEVTQRAAELTPTAADASAQSSDVKLERAKLLAEKIARQGIVQQARLLNVRAQQVADAISDRRRAIFTDSVTERSPSILNPSFWLDLATTVPAAASRLRELLSRWLDGLASEPLRAFSGVAIAAIVVLGFFLPPGRRWQSRWTSRDPGVAAPPALRKTGGAAAIVFAGTVIPGAALLVLYHALIALGVLPLDVAGIVRALFVGTTFAAFFSSLATAVLAPGRPSWRLIDIEDSVSDGAVPLAVLLGFAAAVGVLVDATNRAIAAPTALLTFSQASIALTKAFLFIAVLRAFAPATTDEDEPTAADLGGRSAWRLLIPLGWLAAVATVLAAVSGYVAFARFVTGEMTIICAVLMSFILLSQLGDALVSATFGFQGWMGRFLRQTAGLGNSAVRQIATLIGGLLQLALVGLAGFTILATWGINSDDVLGSISSAFFGFSIGQFTISPSAILGAIIVLIVGMAATRALQRWLDARFLPETNLDLGVRSSIRTGVGYLGIILAVIIALSYVGLNLQNIAIVAGALSVGIGFGLQSIINNFVSGLILLVERPIKVGDRIEVGARMGVVKRINVRATEIATYDNVSVIVPNADLISGQVVNWMHGSYTARLSVAVGVAYDTDPDRVIAILLDIVRQHEKVLKMPEPFAILGNFGADALEFTVFFHVGNISTDAGVANDVRLQILRRFQKEGIEIPFAQRDLRLRDLDRIEALLSSTGKSDAAHEEG